MNIKEFKTYLKSYYETNNVFEIHSLALKDEVKNSERINIFTEFHDKICTLSKDSAERLIKEGFNIRESNNFIKFILKDENVGHVDRTMTELSDYISELKYEIYADTMIMGVDISTVLNKYSLTGTFIRRGEDGILYFDNKQILDIPANDVKDMSNKIIIYNSRHFTWKTKGLSVIISKLKGNGYKVILRSFHEFKFPSFFHKSQPKSCYIVSID